MLSKDVLISACLDGVEDAVAWHKRFRKKYAHVGSISEALIEVKIAEAIHNAGEKKKPTSVWLQYSTRDLHSETKKGKRGRYIKVLPKKSRYDIVISGASASTLNAVLEVKRRFSGASSWERDVRRVASAVERGVRYGIVVGVSTSWRDKQSRKSRDANLADRIQANMKQKCAHWNARPSQKRIVLDEPRFRQLPSQHIQENGKRYEIAWVAVAIPVRTPRATRSAT